MNREQRRRLARTANASRTPNHEEPMTVAVKHAGSLVGIALTPDLRPTAMLLAAFSPAQARQHAAALLNAADAAEEFERGSSARTA